MNGPSTVAAPRPSTVGACIEAGAQVIENLKGELLELEQRLRPVLGSDPRDVNKPIADTQPLTKAVDENYIDTLNTNLRMLSQQVYRVQGIIARLVL